MKIAIVHEMLVKLGGAEKVLQEIMKMYPDADIFTLMYDEKKVGSVFPKNIVRCNTPAQTLFSITGKPRLSLPLMPSSVKKINLSSYDLIISSSSGFAHGVFTTGTTRHICYCHSPARYLWDWTNEIQAELGVSNEKGTMKNEQGWNIISRLKIHIGGPLVRVLFNHLRAWDLLASKRPSLYIANSAEVHRRIEEYYHRDSVILWPPVDTLRFSPEKREERREKREGFVINPPDKGGEGGLKNVSQRTFYVITSALTPFKRVDIPIRVLSKLGINLKIIGEGDQREELMKIAGPTVEFLGRLSDEEVAEAYKFARGFLMPGKEDAGIAPLEAMAAGIPVFGLAQGGLLETNLDGITGRFFPEETDESFEKGFLDFHREIGEGKYDNSATLPAQAKKFDAENFRKGFQEIARR